MEGILEQLVSDSAIEGLDKLNKKMDESVQVALILLDKMGKLEIKLRDIG